MNYFPIAMVIIIPTIIAFWFLLSREYMSVWSKLDFAQKLDKL